MNKNILLASRILVTLIVAGLLSGFVGIIVFLMVTAFGVSNESSLNISNAIAYTIFGLAIGYRMNDLVRERRKS